MDYICVKLPRCVVYLTAAEINQLLMKDPDLFAQALKRGKGILRAQATQERKPKEKLIFLERSHL